MNVLAIEFSSAQRSVAVLCGGRQAQPVATGETVETGGRAANTFALVESALQQAQLERESIDRIAVGLGPGSYTGIRAAISFAQGWQLGRGIPVAGIASTGAIVADTCALGISGKVSVVIDAQRGEYYAAGYEFSPTPGADQADAKELEPLRIVSAEEVLGFQAQGHILVGPEPLTLLPGLRVVPPRALTLAMLALEATCMSAESLAPVYLRQAAFVKAPKPRELG